MRNKTYFNYLCSKVDTGDFNIDDYIELLENLYDERFYWVEFPEDENRVKDALYFRSNTFAKDFPYDYWELKDRPVSIFELMVTLAIRLEKEMMTNMSDDHTGKWLYIMIKNLGLSELTNDNFDRSYFINVIVTFLNRNFEPSGHGGLFVTKNINIDMTKLNIWYQMNEYISSLFNY